VGAARAVAYIIAYVIVAVSRIIVSALLLYLSVRLHLYRMRRRLAREFKRSLEEAGLPGSVARSMARDYSMSLSRRYRVPGICQLARGASRALGFKRSPGP